MHAFSPLAQGLLTDRYLQGIPADSRVASGGAMSESMLTESDMAKVRALNEIRDERSGARRSRVVARGAR